MAMLHKIVVEKWRDDLFGSPRKDVVWWAVRWEEDSEHKQDTNLARAIGELIKDSGYRFDWDFHQMLRDRFAPKADFGGYAPFNTEAAGKYCFQNAEDLGLEFEFQERPVTLRRPLSDSDFTGK